MGPPHRNQELRFQRLYRQGQWKKQRDTYRPMNREWPTRQYLKNRCRLCSRRMPSFETSPIRKIFSFNSFRKLIDVPMYSSSSGLSIVAFRQNNFRHSRIGRSNPIHREMPMDLAPSTSLAVEASVLKAVMAGTLRLQRRGSQCLAPDSLPHASIRTPKTPSFIWLHFSRALLAVGGLLPSGMSMMLAGTLDQLLSWRQQQCLCTTSETLAAPPTTSSRN